MRMRPEEENESIKPGLLKNGVKWTEGRILQTDLSLL
jgi:hypothetical protein